MVTINVDELRGKKAPLYRRYPQQSNAQPASIEMTKAGVVSAGYSGEIGNAVTFDVYHRQTLTWGIPSTVKGEVLAGFLTSGDVVSLLNRIHDGHSVDWDGSNHVGTLTDDAQAASEELETMVDARLRDESAQANVWRVAEWLFSSSGLKEHWSGVPLAEAVSSLEAAAEDEDVCLDGDIEEALLEQAKIDYDYRASNLELVHVQALLDAGEITAGEFESWKQEFCS